MYVSVLLACGGMVATSWDVLRIGLLTLLFVVMYCKASLEERLLHKAFPEYKNLKARTGMFIPWL
jgi:protein-S-isoprenylcysteine O-methyltransferase Ste14